MISSETQAVLSDEDAELQDLIERHRVRLSVYREYGPDEKWREHPVGFDVELLALVIARDPLIDEEAQQTAHEVLVRVASSALRVLDDYADLTYELDNFNNGVILEHGSGPVEVELASHILHNNDVRRELDDEERRGLERVRERLRSLGVRG
jgi:hypothetical protein